VYIFQLKLYLYTQDNLLLQLMLSIERHTVSIAQMNNRIEEKKQFILEKTTTYEQMLFVN